MGFYRIDLLPPPSATIEEEVRGLQLAYQDLSFEHGYPTLADGRPWWHKLDFEPGFAYGAFQIYLEAGAENPRSLGDLSQNTELLMLAGQIYQLPSYHHQGVSNHGRAKTSEPEPVAPTRRQSIYTRPSKPNSNTSNSQPNAVGRGGDPSLGLDLGLNGNGGDADGNAQTRTQTEAEAKSQAQAKSQSGLLNDGQGHGRSGTSTEMTPSRLAQLLTEFSILYNWKARARAYDLFEEAAYRHRKLRRQSVAEDTHYVMASTFLNKLKAEVIDAPAFWKDMDPKVAIDFMQKLVNIQRISSGLPAAGPLTTKEQPDDTGFEMILRTLGRKVAEGNVFDQAGNNLGGAKVVDRVLGDADATTGLQELIIKVTKNSHREYDPEQGTIGRRFKGRGRTQEILDAESLEAYDVDGAPGAHE